MTTLVLTADRNTIGRHDWVGAFDPEARAFMDVHGGVRVQIPQALTARCRFEAALRAVEEHRPDVVAYFGHGLRRQLPQLGMGLHEAAAFGAAIAANATGARVVLYACSAADGTGPGGDGGFCDALRDALIGLGAVSSQVDGHSNGGHTTRNPYVRRFNVRTNVGGDWIVAPGTPLWARWRAALMGPMRFRYPFLTAAEIAAELAPT